MRLLFFSILFMTMTACSSVPVNRDSILSSYSKMDISDGVNEDEMKLIAQRYLLVTSDEPCKSEAQKVKIDSPHIRCGWIDPKQSDGGSYIGFPKKGVFDGFLYVKVSDVTGKAWCAGYLILK